MAPKSAKASSDNNQGDIRSFFGGTSSQISSGRTTSKVDEFMTINPDTGPAAASHSTMKRKKPPAYDENLAKKKSKTIAQTRVATRKPTTSEDPQIIPVVDSDDGIILSRKIRNTQIQASDKDVKRFKRKSVVSSDENEEGEGVQRTLKPESPKKHHLSSSGDKKKSTTGVKKKKEVDTASEDGASTISKPNESLVSASSTKIKPRWIPQTRSGPSNPGSKEIPEGQEGCLSGLTFVFTGEGISLSRDECHELVKRYGGRVTTAPSSKTSYVVLGVDAGPKKIELIKKHRIPTLDEDGFLDLIRSRTLKDVDPQFKKKQKEEEEKIIKQVADLQRQEKDALRVTSAQSASQASLQDISNQLWTVKYAPRSKKDICGNKGQVDKLERWLADWPKSLKSTFKKPGKDGMGGFRSVLIYGPPGIGKTTSAHLIAKELGYEIIEMNASDTRSKKLLETAIKGNVDGRTLGNWSATGHVTPVSINDAKSVLIMDEVDGMSAGDRGGIGALNALIKKTKIPIILIANDARSPKMKPLQHTAYSLCFSRPSVEMVRSRMMSILYKEGMKPKKEAVDHIIASSNSDIRQILGMLSMFRRTTSEMDFDQSKMLSKMNEKNTLQTPWTLLSSLFSPQMFGHTSKQTLNDKLEIYFQDFGMMPLFVQDNYLKYRYARANETVGGSASSMDIKRIELASKAADAISDGDLVDRMIHGSEQHWSLLPTHGIFSTVQPAYYCYGSGQSGGFGLAFPTWFGKNSTQGKLYRLLGDIHIRARLQMSGDRRETRQSYIPTLYDKIVTPLIRDGAGVIDEVIEIMDGYCLSKDDWDSIVELGVGDNDAEGVLKKIPPTTKSAFTRQYNKKTHPIPFIKNNVHLGKSIKSDVVPDLEDVVDIEDDVDEEPQPNDPDDSLDKDKLVKRMVKKPTRPNMRKKDKVRTTASAK